MGKQWKEVELSKCELMVIECDCGYHTGVDLTYLEQVGNIETLCPSCWVLHTVESAE